MHIEETNLELFAYKPESFSVTEKEEILSHLDKCSLCRDIYNTYQNIYTGIDSAIGGQPDENDKELAEKIVNKFEGKQNLKLLTDEKTSVRIFDGKVEIVTKPKFFSLQNIYYLAKNYPVQFGSMVIVTALALAFLVNIVQKKSVDDNPVFADVRNSALNIYNSSGDILWKKTSDGIPEVKSDVLLNWASQKRYVNIFDLDSDGKNEVLISGELYNKGVFKPDSLYCYESDGSRKWVSYPEDISFAFVPKWKRTTWQIRDFFTIKTNKQNRLFVIANDVVYAMTIISEIDPNNGKVLASLYHSGWFMTDLPFDINKDGSEEIFIGATSNDYQKPVLIVLKPSELKGALDKTEFFNQGKITKGNPLYYILFPVSDFGKYLSKSNSYNIYRIHKTDKGISLESEEAYTNGQLGLVFSLDKDMNVINLIPTNPYQKQYDDLYKKGLFKQPLDSLYWKAIKDSILYWDGDKLVNYPTKNKYWNQSEEPTK